MWTHQSHHLHVFKVNAGLTNPWEYHANLHVKLWPRTAPSISFTSACSPGENRLMVCDCSVHSQTTTGCSADCSGVTLNLELWKHLGFLSFLNINLIWLWYVCACERDSARLHFTPIQSSLSESSWISLLRPHCSPALLSPLACCRSCAPSAASDVQRALQNPGEAVTLFISRTKCNKGKQTHFPCLLIAGQWHNVSN